MGGSLEKSNAQFIALLVAIVDSSGVSRVPKLLHQSGCRVTLFAPKGLLVGRSRYVDGRVGTSNDAAKLALELREWMEQVERPYDLTVIGDELMLHAIAAWRGESWTLQNLPVRDHGDPLDLILSKHRFMAAARKAALPVPRSESFETWEEALRVAEEMGFPVMLKKSVGFAGSGVRKAVDPDDLRLALNQLGRGDMVVERFMPGP
jgi:hypothetical protein